MEDLNNKHVEVNAQTGTNRVEEALQSYVGMEFNFYEDAYEFFNRYAKKVGFGTRVRSSWWRNKPDEENSKEYHVILSCSSEGYKRMRESNRLRLDTRTGCGAMMRIKLMESQRWKVTEVNFVHNHLNSPSRARFSRSHKKLEP
ncbi:hypothetical protein IFM89_033299 [Coptis chinensis]|uniref:FAR1 domain-containing protein n=1 Tax=Coptis chinensis TaxID=261450 RepID=A0A835HIH9_9MAGN|nr:hypothetical protein IFM89_033299 [Coptis chinensis]